MSRMGWKPGRWKAICDRCGFVYRSDELRKEWTGLMVCRADFEPRHPQDFLRVPPETVAPPWTRPEATDTFIEVPYILGSDGAIYENDDAIYYNDSEIDYYNGN